jgi:hypothetical protein
MKTYFISKTVTKAELYEVDARTSEEAIEKVKKGLGEWLPNRTINTDIFYQEEHLNRKD